MIQSNISTLRAKSHVLLLLSGGKDSREVLQYLQGAGHTVEGLCIDGIQGQEKVGAEKAAKEFGIPLHVVTLSSFDEETWNPFKLITRDLAMGYKALRIAKSIGARWIATGVKSEDLKHPQLWWLSSFLKVGDLAFSIFGIRLVHPLITEQSR